MSQAVVFDFVFGVSIILGFLVGLKAGFFRQALYFLGVIILLYVAGFFYESIANQIVQWFPQAQEIIGQASGNPFLVFLIVFFVPYVLLLRSNLSFYFMGYGGNQGLLSRLLGGALGALTVAIGAGLVVLILLFSSALLSTNILDEQVIQESYTAPIFIRIADIITSWLPPELQLFG